jgi:hypothetical protein
VGKLKQADLVIFKVNGAYEFIRYMETHGKAPIVQGIFNSSKIKKVLWSVDTHVMQGLETHLSHLQYFDRIYSAHSAFMGNFNATKSAWLPCCYRLSSIRELQKFNEAEYPVERDVLFYYNPTPTGDRNELALRAKAMCDGMALRALFGHVGTWETVRHFIKTSRVNINLSMQGELNYRFFELQAFNAVQVCDRTTDYDKLGVNRENVYFVKRDLSDFEAVLKKALGQAISLQTENWVMESHMLIHRIVQVMNDVLGVSARVEF